MDNCGMTIVGTLRRNKKYFPAEIVDVKNRSKQSSAFLYYGNITLVSSVPNKKNVLLLSSTHHQPTLEENGKPETVMYHNSTKGGIDPLDQMYALYSCSRKTRRWSLCVFYGMLNIAAVNSCVIYCSNMRRNGGSIISRNNFLGELALLLKRLWAEERAAY